MAEESEEDPTRGLEAAMDGMEMARAGFEAAALRVGAELEALQDCVIAANSALGQERTKIAVEESKRRRLSGQPAGQADPAAAANPDEQAERAFHSRPAALWPGCTTRSSGPGRGWTRPRRARARCWRRGGWLPCGRHGTRAAACWCG